MSQTPTDPLHSFAYRAATRSGGQLTGAIDATDTQDARARLEAMGLEVREVAAEAQPARRGRLDHASFIAFNQQLAALTRAGMPVESGLRLIAQETRRGGLRRAITGVADDIERGVSLGDAFAAKRSAFPPLYGRLIDAGVQAGDLPGMLYNLGRHLDLLGRLRATVWQAVAYPLAVLLVLAAVVGLLAAFVFPRFVEVFQDFDTDMPLLTLLVIDSSAWLPFVMLIVVIVILSTPVLWALARLLRWDVVLADGVGMVLPLIGGVLRKNLLARWFDTVRLGVDAGLDLPRAMQLGSDAMGSPSLTHDVARLVDAMHSGRTLSQADRLWVIPVSATATMQIAADQGRLSQTLATLTELYREQAEARVALVNVLLTPFLLLLLAFVLGLMVIAMFLPLVKLMQSVM